LKSLHLVHRPTLAAGIGFLVSFLVLSAWLSPIRVHAAAYYVDYDSGNDNNNGQSQATAWRHAPGMAGASSVPAATALVPGDTVFFKSGVIWPAAALPLNPAWSGTSSQPVVFARLSGWGTGDYAILDGQNSDAHAIDLNNYSQRQYVVFDGFWLRNTTGAAFANRENHNITLRNFRVTGCGATEDACVFAYRRTIFERGIVDANRQMYGILVGYANHEIRQNDVSNAFSALIRVQTRSDSTVVEKNYLHDLTMPSGGLNSALIFRSSSYGTIRYNIIDLSSGAGHFGIKGWNNNQEGPLGNRETQNKVYGNTIIMNGVLGVDSSGIQFANQDDLQVFNNIIVNAEYGFGCVTGSPNSSILVKYNLYFQVRAPYEGCWIGNPAFSIGSGELVNQNPQFSNTGSKPVPYYNLVNSSPAVNTGDPATPAGMDYKGARVPIGSGFDIGALEYSSDSVPPAPPPNLRTQ